MSNWGRHTRTRRVWNGFQYIDVPVGRDRGSRHQDERRPMRHYTPPPPDPRRLDSKNPPPYGEKVFLAERVADLPAGLVGNVPEKDVYKMFSADPEKCFVYFREQGYHIPFGKLRLA